MAEFLASPEVRQAEEEMRLAIERAVLFGRTESNPRPLAATRAEAQEIFDRALDLHKDSSPLVVVLGGDQ